MLPHEPETMAKMKVRFSAAIAETIDVDAVNAGKVEAPSKQRKHVFDFQDGMRLIFSIDKTDGIRFVHTSASGSESYFKTLVGENIFNGFVEDALLRMAALLGKSPNNVAAYLSGRGVLHLVFKEET